MYDPEYETRPAAKDDFYELLSIVKAMANRLDRLEAFVHKMEETLIDANPELEQRFGEPTSMSEEDEEETEDDAELVDLTGGTGFEDPDTNYEFYDPQTYFV